MNGRLNINLDEQGRSNLKELVALYEEELGGKPSLSVVVRMAIRQALIVARINQAK